MKKGNSYDDEKNIYYSDVKQFARDYVEITNLH